ncbi:hypothetical protein EOPP23_08685 [Endozoicomonas sp. OPT23]|uniref:hypothetical protein n=1 Tax=Endozoicomonas sp. OPT23 TaxID=2072845 RepID=UPI00129BED0A|nr:hypothetical protein [Endozoicomonas sp. OPT23]MRI33058.1 hypothetical protein [Endozoicomonas sp. OPT23]
MITIEYNDTFALDSEVQITPGFVAVSIPDEMPLILVTALTKSSMKPKITSTSTRKRSSEASKGADQSQNICEALQGESTRQNGVPVLPPISISLLNMLDPKQPESEEYDLGMNPSKYLDRLSRFSEVSAVLTDDSKPLADDLTGGATLMNPQHASKEFFPLHEAKDSVAFNQAASLIGRAYTSKIPLLNQSEKSAKEQRGVYLTLSHFPDASKSVPLEFSMEIRFALEGHFKRAGAYAGRFDSDFRTEEGVITIQEGEEKYAFTASEQFFDYLLKQLDSNNSIHPETIDDQISLITLIEQLNHLYNLSPHYLSFFNAVVKEDKYWIPMIPSLNNMEFLYHLLHAYFLDQIYLTKKESGSIDINDLLARHFIPIFRLLSPWNACNETTLYHTIRFYQAAFSTKNILSPAYLPKLLVTLDPEKIISYLSLPSQQDLRNQFQIKILHRERTESESSANYIDLSDVDPNAESLEPCSDQPKLPESSNCTEGNEQYLQE